MSNVFDESNPTAHLRTGDSNADMFAQLDRIEAKLDQLLAKKKPKPRAAKKFEYPDWFEYLWAHYPCTKGGNKKKALAVIKQRMDEDSFAYDKIVQGLDEYKRYIEATGRYPKLPETFFGPDKHYENDWTIPDSARKSAIPRNDDEMVKWATTQPNLRKPRPGESYNAYRAYVESEA